MSEQIKFYKGLEENLPTGKATDDNGLIIDPIEVGALYHCTDTGNTYRGVAANRMELFSTANRTQIQLCVWGDDD